MLLVVAFPCGFICHGGFDDILPFRGVPTIKLGVHIEVFLGNGMSAIYHFDIKPFFQEIFESGDIGTRRITDNHPCCQVDNLCAISDHFTSGIFNIATRAAVTGSVANKFWSCFINTKCTFSVFKRFKAFSPCTPAISVTDNNSNFYGICHIINFSLFFFTKALIEVDHKIGQTQIAEQDQNYTRQNQI